MSQNVSPALRRDTTATLFNSLSMSFKGFGIQLRLLNGNVDDNLPLRLHELPFQFANVLISTPDPSPTVLNIENLNDMDQIFTNAPNALGSGGQDVDGNDILSVAERFFKDVKSKGIRMVLTFMIPSSWLLSDGSYQLTGARELRGYANYILSGVKWVRSYGIAADMVEIAREPDNENDGFGWISPTDIVIFVEHLRLLSIERSLTTPYIKFLAPGLSTVLPLDTTQEFYTLALRQSRNSFDIWSIHALESAEDQAVTDACTFASRTLVSDRLERNVAQMNSVNFSLDKMVTDFSSTVTRLPRIKMLGSELSASQYVEHGIDGDIQDTQEFAIRILEHICGIWRNGFFSAIYGGGLTPWRKTVTTYGEGEEPPVDDEEEAPVDDEEEPPVVPPVDEEEEPEIITTTTQSIEERSLYSDNDTLRPVGKLFKQLLSELPIPGDLFISEELNRTGDKTVKALITTSTVNRFYFILCRPNEPDALEGKLRLVVNNPLWSTSYETSELLITSYPEASKEVVILSENDEGEEIQETVREPGVDLYSVSIKSKFSQGTLTFDLKGLPYGGCVLFFSGVVKLKPPVPYPNPTPTPTPVPLPGGGTGTPVVIQTIIQMPVNYGEPTMTDYAIGTIYYDSKSRKLKTFVDGTWIAAPTLEYV